MKYGIKARHCVDFAVCVSIIRNLSDASVVKLVDTGDSKSPAFTGVAVRVRPLVPLYSDKTYAGACLPGRVARTKSPTVFGSIEQSFR